MQQTEADIRNELTARAEKLFGKNRTAELKSDLEQLSAEVFKICSFKIEPTDEPA